MEAINSKREISIKNSILISFFYVCFIIFYLFKDYKFELHHIEQIIFSDANAYGTDINLRVNLYYKLLAIGIPLFFIFISLFNKLFKHLYFNINQYFNFHLFGILGLTSIITHFIGTKNEVLVYILFWISLFRLLTIVISKVYKRAQILKNDTLFYVVLSTSFLIYYLLLYLLNLKNLEQFIGFILLGSLVIYLSLITLQQYKKINIRKLTIFLTPLTLIPLLSFIAIEFDFFYYYTHNVFLGFKKIFLILLFSTFLFIYFFLSCKKNFKTTSTQLVTKFFGPSILIAFTLMVFYQPIIEFNNETFELANSTNAMLRIFKLHQIPFIDYLSSHMLYEQWYGIIYNLIFGYKNTIDFTIYAFFNKLFLIFTIYYFLNKLFKNSFLSVIFILCFHYIDYVFFQHVFLCVILLFIFQNSIVKNTVIIYFLLFIFTFLLIFYRLDTGIVGAMTMISFLTLWFFTNNFKINYKKILKAIGLTISTISILVVIAFALRDKKVIFENITLAMHYISSNQAHGLHTLSVHYPHQFLIYHLFFPFILASIFLYTIYSLYRNKIESCYSKDQVYVLNTILFISILFIINFQRGIVRHGFAEENEYYLISTFFVTLSLFVVFISKIKTKILQFTIFYCILFSSFILFKYFPLPKETSYFERAIKQNSFRNNIQTINNIDFKGRVIEDSLKSIHRYDSLISFLNKKLNKNQTFIDFSNTPILYYYAEKYIPGYFNQNLQNTVDEFTQLSLLKELNPYQFPIVLYASYPLTWFDQTDDIPNQVRYNLISEFIHKNYTPFKIINGKNIWIAKHTLEKNDTIVESLYSNVIPINYRRLSEFIGDYYQRKKFDKLGVIFSTRNFIQEKNNTTLISTPFLSKAYHHCYLDIFFSKKSKVENSVRVQLLDSIDQTVGDFYFENYHTTRKHFFLRVSNSYLWHTKNVKKIKLFLNQGDLLKKVTFYKDLRFEN
jgi:hypothetical protein